MEHTATNMLEKLAALNNDIFQLMIHSPNGLHSHSCADPKPGASSWQDPGRWAVHCRCFPRSRGKEVEQPDWKAADRALACQGTAPAPWSFALSAGNSRPGSQPSSCCPAPRGRRHVIRTPAAELAGRACPQEAEVPRCISSLIVFKLEQLSGSAYLCFQSPACRWR